MPLSMFQNILNEVLRSVESGMTSDVSPPCFIRHRETDLKTCTWSMIKNIYTKKIDLCMRCCVRRQKCFTTCVWGVQNELSIFSFHLAIKVFFLCGFFRFQSKPCVQPSHLQDKAVVRCNSLFLHKFKIASAPCVHISKMTIYDNDSDLTNSPSLAIACKM